VVEGERLVVKMTGGDAIVLHGPVRATGDGESATFAAEGRSVNVRLADIGSLRLRRRQLGGTTVGIALLCLAIAVPAALMIDTLDDFAR
jgi:hypothetical protein